MSTKNKIILMISIVLAVIVILIFLPKFTKPTKYELFAKALSVSGTKFYGAFWCTHCQAQKAEFGSAKKYLPYIECSEPDGKTQKQVCIDAKIEGYPTWIFPNELVLEPGRDPIFCPIKTETSEVSDNCKYSTSELFNTWIFTDEQYGFSIRSVSEPIIEENIWKFPVGVQASGEIPMEFLAEQIDFVLPQ